jgi:hypothetical protein
LYGIHSRDVTAPGVGVGYSTFVRLSSELRSIHLL